MSSTKKVTLAAACMRGIHNKERNLQKIKEYIEKAAKVETRLIAFPECALQGYTWSWDPVRCAYVHDEEQLQYFRESAEVVPGPATEIVSKYARDHNMFIQFGLAEKTSTSTGIKLYNAAVLVGPKGVVAKFRKIHMAPNAIFERGDEFAVTDTPMGKVGQIICADLEYPESTRCLALNGAEIVLNSTAYPMIGRTPSKDFSGYMFELFTKTNAVMNQLWMVHSNQIGRAEPSNQYMYGHSRIVDPMGRVVADTGYREGIAIASVDLKGELLRSRGPEFVGHDFLQFRQPDAYGDILIRGPHAEPRLKAP